MRQPRLTLRDVEDAEHEKGLSERDGGRMLKNDARYRFVLDMKTL